MFLVVAHENIAKTTPKGRIYFSKIKENFPLLPLLPKWPETENQVYDIVSRSISVLFIFDWNQMHFGYPLSIFHDFELIYRSIIFKDFLLKNLTQSISG